MRVSAGLLVLCTLATAQDAGDVFRRAVARQEGLRYKDIKSVYLKFDGHAELDKATQALRREYWYTAGNRTFKQITQSKARGSARSERGVDETSYWNGAGKSFVRLSRGNADHRDMITAIDADRTDFERILKMVLLTRLEGSRISFAAPPRVKLRTDRPWSARSILGSDREEHEYHVLRVEAKDAPPLLLYVRTSDHTVRKAVQLPGRKGKQPVYYYFAYSPDGKLPVFFSAHKAEPTDVKTRKSSTLARGEISVRLERVSGG